MIHIESEVPTRACTSAERRAGRDGLGTHATKVLDEPCQIIVLDVLNSVSVLVRAKDVAKLLVELR